MYVTQLLDGSVVRLTPDNATGSWSQAVVAQGIPLADGIAIEAGGATALVGTFWVPGLFLSGQLTRIDLTSGAQLAALGRRRLWLPAQMALADARPDGTELYVAEMLGQAVSQLVCDDAARCTKRRAFPVRFPTGVCRAPDGATLYAVESFSGWVVRFDVAAGTKEKIVRLGRQ
jgi:sugar lactone lactonase YvrE